MKKIIIGLSILAMMCLVVGCGVNCPSEPPKRAYFYKNGAYGMTYHLGIFPPYGELSHSGGCTKYDYASSHLYMDKNHGEIRGDEIVWKNIFGEELPLEERGGVLSNISVTISNDSVTISGSPFESDNGVYKIETTPPNSWGVPIN